MLLSSHIRPQPELCLLLSSFDKNGSFSFKFIIRQNSLLPEALPEFGLTWHTDVARQHNLKEPCGFYIWGRLFPSIWANTQRAAGRLGTNEKEMIWNIHAVLPANQSAMTWQASSFLSSPVTPLKSVSTQGCLQSCYEMFTALSLLASTYTCVIKVWLCVSSKITELDVSLVCLRNTANIISGFLWPISYLTYSCTFWGLSWVVEEKRGIRGGCSTSSGPVPSL